MPDAVFRTLVAEATISNAARTTSQSQHTEPPAPLPPSPDPDAEPDRQPPVPPRDALPRETGGRPAAGPPDVPAEPPPPIIAAGA